MKPADDHQRNMAPNMPVDSLGGLYACDNPSLAMQSHEKEDEDGSNHKFGGGDACADEDDNAEVRL